CVERVAVWCDVPEPEWFAEDSDECKELGEDPGTSVFSNGPLSHPSHNRCSLDPSEPPGSSEGRSIRRRAQVRFRIGHGLDNLVLSKFEQNDAAHRTSLLASEEIANSDDGPIATRDLFFDVEGQLGIANHGLPEAHVRVVSRNALTIGVGCMLSMTQSGPTRST